MKTILAILLVFISLIPNAIANNALKLGEDYRNQANYPLATQTFENVLKNAEKSNDKLGQIVALAELGYTYYLAGNAEKAKPLLEKASAFVPALNNPELAALIDDYLGMTYLSLELNEQAAQRFNSALTKATSLNNSALILTIQSHQTRLENDTDQKANQLIRIGQDITKLPDNEFKIKSLLAISEDLLSLLENTGNKTLVEPLYELLNQAHSLTDNNSRLRSQSEGYLAKLYQLQDLNEDALQWLDKAIFDAQQANATDLLMQWELDIGKLLRQTNQYSEGIAAYQRAIKHLNDIRYSLPALLPDGKSSIRGFVDPIYRGLADILLLQAEKTQNAIEKQQLLSQAIDAIETIKQTELEDYFNDRCLIDKDEFIDLKTALLPNIGIIYPIILPDRVELLFRTGDNKELKQSSTPTSVIIVNKTIEQTAQYLREGQGNYRPNSRQLYQWLLKPYDELLKSKGIKTIVYLPDGALRQIPFSILLNNKRFAIEDYEIVTLPRLVLKQNAVRKETKKYALIAALSKPDGGSLDELLNGSFNNILGQRSIEESLLPDITVTAKPEDKRALLVEKLSLPSVNQEISALQKDFNNTSLINQQFTEQEFKSSVITGDYDLVHIASHGFFGKNADNSFIMMYDRNLKLPEFQTILNAPQIKYQPIDLLTLSACQTASGDDKALLGFSGIAIRTNTLSAIGTLWSVNDEATSTFMQSFYQHLETLPKASALRQAQLGLLKTPKFKHPYYWSPFVLVGHW